MAISNHHNPHRSSLPRPTLTQPETTIHLTRLLIVSSALLSTFLLASLLGSTCVQSSSSCKRPISGASTFPDPLLSFSLSHFVKHSFMRLVLKGTLARIADLSIHPRSCNSNFSTRIPALRDPMRKSRIMSCASSLPPSSPLASLADSGSSFLAQRSKQYGSHLSR